MFNHCAEQLAMAEATILRSQNISDIALHRNVVAGMAMQFLEAHAALKYVLWLDDDMVFSVEDIQALRWFCRSLDAPVTASYCKRGKPAELTWAFAGAEYSKRNAALPTADVVDVYPVVAGMGAMMLSRDDFTMTCKAVHQFAKVEANGKKLFPAVCWTTAIPDEKTGIVEWVSEDRAYSSLLWSVVGGLWGVPVALGHVSEVPLLPTSDASWL